MKRVYSTQQARQLLENQRSLSFKIDNSLSIIEKKRGIIKSTALRL